MKDISNIQKEIINDHLMIEGSWKFDYYTCEDDISVVMVNEHDDEVIKITKWKNGGKDQDGGTKFTNNLNHPKQ